MKRYSIHTLLLSGLSLLCFAACSDEYMEEINSDPSKATTIDPNAQLTTAQLQTYGDLDLTETFRSYLYAFTQQTMGCWNTTNYGGRPQLRLFFPSPTPPDPPPPPTPPSAPPTPF